MKLHRGATAALLALCALLATVGDAAAQLDRIRRGAERVRDSAGQAPAAAAPAATEAPPAIPPTAPAAPAAMPGAASAPEGAFVNYDFIPGTRALYVDDFERDRVGNFPRRLHFIEGNLELAEWRGGRFLRTTSRPGRFAVQLPETLPERFTIEFDASPGYPNDYIVLRFAENAAEEIRFRGFAGRGQGGVWGPARQSLGQTEAAVGPADLLRARIMADGDYVKVYVDGTRVANVPNAALGRSGRIVFEVPGDAEHPGYFGNVSVLQGDRGLYDALDADGRVATQGIRFDTGSDRIRAESAPTLQEIAAMLRHHATLRLRIEGHTDNIGNAAANRVLAEQRAAAVRQHLVGLGIDGARLESAGLGDTRPAAPNDTPEGRQQNRRVELVRL
jgi:OmpA-OmpF porin, OOP family